MELIERQAAIEAAKKLLDYYGTNDISKEFADHTAEQFMNRVPSTQQWILCSERLPEKSGRYLVTNTRLGAFEVTWNIFYNEKGEAPEGWLYEDGTSAWMPLPEPYKGEES